MPTNSSGIYTLPSGSTAVSGTTIDPAAFNTMTADIADALTARLPVNGAKGMTGPLSIADGTVASPAVQFSSDTNTGLYKTATGYAVSIDGVKVVEFTAAGALNAAGTAYTVAPTIAWADVASAAATDLGAQASANLRITGTTTITAFGTVASGTEKELRFAGAVLLTYNATSLILPTAANITTAAGDTCRAISLGSGNWVVVDYMRASGRALVVDAAYTANRTYAEYTANTSLVTALPIDNTIPQITEGTQVFSVSFTPTSASKRVRIRSVLFGGANADKWGQALFINGATAAVRAVATYTISGVSACSVLEYEYLPGVATALTIAIRAGADTGTLNLNAATSLPLFSTVAGCTLVVEEIP